MSLRVVLDAVLQENHAVHEVERLKCDIVRLNDIDAVADPAQSITTVADHVVPDFISESAVLHLGTARESFIYPLFI